MKILLIVILLLGSGITFAQEKERVHADIRDYLSEGVVVPDGWVYNENPAIETWEEILVDEVIRPRISLFDDRLFDEDRTNYYYPKSERGITIGPTMKFQAPKRNTPYELFKYRSNQKTCNCECHEQH